MGLFNFKKKDEEQAPRNPNTLIMVRVLAIGYLLYSFWEILQMYLEGGEDAPQWWLLLLSFVVLVGGAVWIAVMAYKEWKRAREWAQKLQDEEDARLEAEAADADAEDMYEEEESEPAEEEE